MKWISLIVSMLVSTSSISQTSTATFNTYTGLLSIPSVRLGSEDYPNLKLEWDGSVSFQLVSVDEKIAAVGSPTGEYLPEINRLIVDSLSYQGRSYSDVTFSVDGNTLVFESIHPNYEGISSVIALPREAIPIADNPALTMQMVAAVDLNLDGLKDIVAHLWHNNWNAGEDFYGEVPNKLAVFLQSSDKYFSYANENILIDGLSDFNGSASRKQVIADFNDDGYPDIGYAMNREDGRRMSKSNLDYGESNWGSKAAVLLSNGEGKYQLSTPDPDEDALWYHAVAAVPNGLGYYDLILRSKPGSTDPALAYRWVNGLWTSLDSYPYLQGWEIQGSSNYIWASETFSAVLYALTDSGWSLVDNYSTASLRGETVQVKTWNGELSQQSTVDLYDKLRVSFAFSEQCILDDGELFVSAVDSRILPEDWREKSFVVETEMIQDSPFMLFDINNQQLRLRDDLLPSQLSTFHSYRFSCDDYNFDGLDDIFASALNGTNVLYLQQADQSFEPQSQLIFPSQTSFTNANQVRSLFDDLNGDGIIDLLYYTNTPDYQGGKPTFEVFWGS